MGSILEIIRSWPMPLLLLGPLIFVLLMLRIKQKRLPPGPRGWPIIGNMGLIDQLTHHGFAKLAKTYGGIFHLRVGFLHTIVISSPDIARQVLQVQDHIFANRPANTIGIRYLSYDVADLAFRNYGPFWRQMRKLCVMKLFSRKRAESWESVRDEVDNMILSVAASIGSSVNLGEKIFELTRGITYRAAFGTRSKKGQEQFIGIIQEFSQLFGTFSITDFLPNPGWADRLVVTSRLINARKSLDGFIDEIIDDHIERRVSGNMSVDADTDMVDELLAFYGDEPNVTESDDLKTIKVTRENIKSLIMDVMFGGTETVASVIEWTMAELMRNPEDLKRVQQELATVIGLHRRLDDSDLENLTFFKCTIKEVLRLHPPIPIISHGSSKDTTLAGYHIPANSRIAINAYAIGRDPTSWADPETFRPSRFLEEGAADFKGSDFQFIPFGAGRRSCPAMQLGLYASEIAVGNLLHCFNWELPDGMKPNELDMSDSFGVTAPRATRLVAVPTPRLVCPM